jgi:RNase P subunit RPR2
MVRTGVGRKTKPKAEASQAARKLLAQATAAASTDLELAKHQAELARKLMLRYNVRFGWELKRFYCHKCKKMIVPGANAKVRVGGNPKTVRIACQGCGHVNRRVLS